MPSEVPSAETLAVEAFGVAVQIVAEPRHRTAVRELLPPHARPASRPDTARFELVPSTDRHRLAVHRDGLALSGPVEIPVALTVLDAQIRMHIALHAPNHVFVQAGVVGVSGRAIVLPGKSFAGKTTLVNALLDAGAEYWSDEYAALDSHGLVHPYPRPAPARGDRVDAETTPDNRGRGGAGARTLPVGLVAIAHYRPGAAWTPRKCSAGEGAIKLLEHTICARSRPEHAMGAVRQALGNAIVLEGERGEAEPVAAALLRSLLG